MYRVKKVEEILSENKWTYDADQNLYVFPELDRSIKPDTLLSRAGKLIDEEAAKPWPAQFLTGVPEEKETLHKVKVKDLHIALMMTDYKVSENGISLIFQDTDFHYPSAFLPKFGEFIEVRKNENGDLEEVTTKAIIHPLLIEGVISSRQALLNTLYSFFGEK